MTGRRRGPSVDRWALARTFDVHPGTVALWRREGLDVALIHPGGPGKPAMFDGRVAIRWFNNRKALDGRRWRPRTMADLQAAVKATARLSAPPASTGDDPPA